MITACPARDQRVRAARVPSDPVVPRYRACCAYLDWTVVPERDAGHPWPGPLPHPTRAYVKALLITRCAHKEYSTPRRVFLGEHPLLVLEGGFRPGPDATQP